MSTAITVTIGVLIGAAISINLFSSGSWDSAADTITGVWLVTLIKRFIP